MLTIQNYVKAESLEQAWELNQKRRNRILGGMLWTKMGSQRIQTAIDLTGLGLDTIEETEEEFRIGCMVSLRQLEEHAGLQSYTDGALKEALRHIVGVQFRNLATVGGSIFGRFGFSDVLTMFLVMDTFVELYKGGVQPLAEFASAPKDRDILVRLIVKKHPAKFVYRSVRNSKTDFPVLTCAAAQGADGWRFSVGARPQRAVVLTDQEGILAGGSAAAEAFGEYAAEQISTGSNMRGSAAYRKHLIRVLVMRCVQNLCMTADEKKQKEGDGNAD